MAYTVRFLVSPGTELIRTNQPLMGEKATAPACPIMRVRLIATAAGVARVDYFGSEFACRYADLIPATATEGDPRW